METLTIRCLREAFGLEFLQPSSHLDGGIDNLALGNALTRIYIEEEEGWLFERFDA